ncbi:MAG: hypothetical protein K0S11_705 [Gammaproteobacteria bacterium]|jgi:sec-independent protein translocase protein TatB|nr:hypothetical protein [Gammaproteobacteria bacterium]
MSLSEILLILLVALIVLGPKRLPEVAYWLGRCMQWFNALRCKLQTEFNNQVKVAELKHNETKAAAAEQHNELHKRRAAQNSDSSESS